METLCHNEKQQKKEKVKILSIHCFDVIMTASANTKKKCVLQCVLYFTLICFHCSLFKSSIRISEKLTQAVPLGIRYNEGFALHFVFSQFKVL